MHEFRRGGEGEVRSSTRGGRVVFLGMIRGVIAAASIERDIAQRRGEGTDGEKKFESGRSESVECAREHVALQRQRAWRGSHEQTSFSSLPPRRSSSTFTCRRFLLAPGSIYHRTTFVLFLCPLTFESDRWRWVGSTGKNGSEAVLNRANPFGEESAVPITPIYFPDLLFLIPSSSIIPWS